MQKKKPINVNIILKRLKSLLGISTDVQMAELLQVKPNTLSTWKQRNSIDYKLIIEAAQSCNLDLNKVFYEEDLTDNKEPGKNFTPIITSENIQQYINNEFQEKLYNLPQYNFILGQNSRNIAFQVPTNRLAPLIPEESFAVCELSSLEEIKEETYYVLISKKYGFFLSRVKLINNTFLELLDIQTTGIERNYSVKQKYIHEIWKVIGISTYKPIM